MDARIKSRHDDVAFMSASFHLRPYRTEDEDAAIALWQRTWQQTYPSIDFAARVPWWRERWRNELVANAAIIVAEQADTLIGFVTIDLKGYLDQLVVSPTHWGSELGNALLDDAAFVHHHDPVAGQHRGEAMGDHQRGAMMHQFLQRRLHQRFALGIERRCCLVEQQQRRVAQDRTRNGDTLALPSRQRHAAFAELRLESTRQAADEFGGVSKLGGTLDLGVIGIGPAEADVFARGRGEHHGILGHQRDTRTQLARISRSDRNAVERDHTMRA